VGHQVYGRNFIQSSDLLHEGILVADTHF
jgi:hypothetical protein